MRREVRGIEVAILRREQEEPCKVPTARRNNGMLHLTLVGEKLGLTIAIYDSDTSNDSRRYI